MAEDNGLDTILEKANTSLDPASLANHRRIWNRFQDCIRVADWVRSLSERWNINLSQRFESRPLCWVKALAEETALRFLEAFR